MNTNFMGKSHSCDIYEIHFVIMHIMEKFHAPVKIVSGEWLKKYALYKNDKAGQSGNTLFGYDLELVDRYKTGGFEVHWRAED